MGLTQGSTEGTAEYMARVRGFDARLNKVTISDVMNIFYLLEKTVHRYDSILNRDSAGDTSVVTADLAQIESLMMGEDEQKKILGLDPSKIVLSKYKLRKTKKAARKGIGGANKKPQTADNKNPSGRRETSVERPP